MTLPTTPESLTCSAKDSAGLFSFITNPNYLDQIGDFHARLAMTAAMIALNVCEVGVDSPTAARISERAIEAFLKSTAITLGSEELAKIYDNATQLHEQRAAAMPIAR